MHIAVEKNDENIVQIILKECQRISINEPNKKRILIYIFYDNYLHIACKNRNSNIVAALISKGVNINDKNILNFKNFNDEGILKN